MTFRPELKPTKVAQGINIMQNILIQTNLLFISWFIGEKNCWNNFLKIFLETVWKYYFGARELPLDILNITL
jgi:hypothetical protein